MVFYEKLVCFAKKSLEAAGEPFFPFPFLWDESISVQSIKQEWTLVNDGLPYDKKRGYFMVLSELVLLDKFPQISIFILLSEGKSFIILIVVDSDPKNG
ncbi:MAG: hypothetical protein HFJ84_06615 [Clostridiales bacterium]|nr:hypothetical protein [Clostridiales bacterium]